MDKYQGQQNDYILLSLVRTESVGHLRDVRRLVVALSRARLGLYVFGRLGLFKQCPELQQAFSLLIGEKSTKLQLVGADSFPTSREHPHTSKSPLNESLILSVDGVTDMGVLVYQMVQQAQNLPIQK